MERILLLRLTLRCSYLSLSPVGVELALARLPIHLRRERLLPKLTFSAFSGSSARDADTFTDLYYSLLSNRLVFSGSCDRAIDGGSRSEVLRVIIIRRRNTINLDTRSEITS